MANNIKKYNDFVNETGGYDSPGLYNSHSWHTVRSIAGNLYAMKDAYINLKQLEEEVMLDDRLRSEVNKFLEKVEPLLPHMDHLDEVLYDSDQANFKKFSR